MNYKSKNKELRLSFISKKFEQFALGNFKTKTKNIDTHDEVEACNEIEKYGLDFYNYKNIVTFEDFIFTFCHCSSGVRCIILIKTDNLKTSKNNYTDIVFSIIKDFEDKFIMYKNIKYRVIENRTYIDCVFDKDILKRFANEIEIKVEQAKLKNQEIV